MVETIRGVFISERLKAMIRKYAANPELFFRDGQINRDSLERLVTKVSIEPGFKDGRACIKGTNIMVCDVVGDTVSLVAPVGFERTLYGSIIPHGAIDAAYAFTILHLDKVASDRELTYGCSLSQDLYH